MKSFSKLILTGALSLLSLLVSAQDRPDLLWVVGDAVKNGWSLDDATAIAGTDGIFSGTLYLEAGKSFKFLTTWDYGNNEYRALTPGAKPDADGKVNLVAADNNSADDHQFNVSESANYLITVNTAGLNATIVKSAYQESQIHTASLFIVGNVLETGFDVAKGLVMTQDPSRPFEFSVRNTTLNSGDFKIASALKGACSWNPRYWLFRDPADSGKYIADSPDDNKWDLGHPGEYDITVNTLGKTINIAKATPSSVEIITGPSAGGQHGKYFNISGQPVDNPVKGQLLIHIGSDGRPKKIVY